MILTLEQTDWRHTLDRVTTRVLIVDDHPDFRADARELLDAAGYDVVGEAEDGASAIAAAQRLAPDVILLDVQLPDRDGFSVAAELAASGNAARIVLISSREAADYGTRIEHPSVAGFIHKPELSRARLAELVGGAG